MAFDRSALAALSRPEKLETLHAALTRLAPTVASAARILAHVDAIGLDAVSDRDAEEVLSALADLGDQADAERRQAAERGLEAARLRLEEALRRERAERLAETAAAKKNLDTDLA